MNRPGVVQESRVLLDVDDKAYTPPEKAIGEKRSPGQTSDELFQLTERTSQEALPQTVPEAETTGAVKRRTS